jgi:hypothetical protein
MKLISYYSPTVKSYGLDAFLSETHAVAPVIERALLSNRVFSKTGPWIYHDGDTINRRRPEWRPKLYVCVGPHAYWQTVCRFVMMFNHSQVRWKFYAGSTGYDRPDKLVLYADNERQLKALIPDVQQELRDVKSFHHLAHAAPAAAFSVGGKNSAGIYVGADPVFLGVSWRWYRTVALAWLAINRRHVAETRSTHTAWLNDMNMSTDHEGPLLLLPSASSSARIKGQWKLMIGNNS